MVEVEVGPLAELEDPGCREFQIGDGDWPLRGFIVRQGDDVYAYENYCLHVGHPLNWMPDGFLSKDRTAILCASSGAPTTTVSFAGTPADRESRRAYRPLCGQRSRPDPYQPIRTNLRAR